MAAITAAVATAGITPSEVAALSMLVATFIGAIETNEFDQRLRAIEARGDAKRT